MSDDGLISLTKCRKEYGLTNDELAALGPPRIGSPQPGSRETTKVYRLEDVLELVERLRPQCGARAAAEARTRDVVVTCSTTSTAFQKNVPNQEKGCSDPG